VVEVLEMTGEEKWVQEDFIAALQLPLKYKEQRILDLEESLDMWRRQARILWEMGAAQITPQLLEDAMKGKLRDD
jgi:hypothetical protein